MAELVPSAASPPADSMSTASPHSVTAARIAGSRNNTLLVRSIIAVALLGVFALLAFFAVQWFGVVSGVEFSPDTFSQREFRYYELPLLRWRISRVYHVDLTGPLEKRVRDDKNLFPPAKAKPPRWHLVAMERSRTTYTDDALIVWRYFNEESDAPRRWLKWNREHPELAKILWPAIVEVCRGERYIFAPSLFAAAEQFTTDQAKKEFPASEFRTLIGETLAEQYVQLATAEQGLERHKEAVELFTAALAHDANDIAALRGRALSYVALREAAKANADREAVKKLERAAR
jgi:hypothetical protein